MELAIQDLKLNEATNVIDYYGEDPYQMVQVHDYLNVKFLRMNHTIKSASRQTIDVFSMAYPELLKEKYFVNVPAVMGWLFAAMKALRLSKTTFRKFHPVSNGAYLAHEISGFGDEIPKSYGGKGGKLAECARTVNLDDEAVQAATTPAASGIVAAESNETPATTKVPTTTETSQLTEKIDTISAPEATITRSPSETPVVQ
jgi:hypothetical protein